MSDKEYIGATGNDSAQIMIIGESPSYDELKSKKPFTGPSGEVLNTLLNEAGINRNDCWVSNVVKYFVTPNQGTKKIPFLTRAKADGINIEECLKELQNEVNQIKPNLILALGGTALWATTGKKPITDYRGSILYGMGRKVIATYHPAHLLHNQGGEFKGYWNRSIILLDIKRALEESHSPKIELPYRNLQICKSSGQLYDYIQRNKGNNNPSVDIEAGGTCTPICVGFSYKPSEGLTVPLFPNSVLNISESEYVQFWFGINEILTSQKVIGQNFKYDEDKLRRFGFTLKGLASDVMLKSFTINPELPKNLAFNTSIWTREPFYKNEGMYEGKLEDLFLGCARDACVTKEIDLKMDADIDALGLRDWYENFIMQLHPLYLNIENEGFYIDEEVRKKLFDKYVRWSEKLSYELYQLTNVYTNVASPKQVAVLLFEILKLPKRPGTGEEELSALLNNQGSTGVHNPIYRRVIEIILEKRQVDKTIGTYLTAMPDYDGKMKTTYYLCLETGRTSTGMLEPPIRQSIELKNEVGQKKKKFIGTAFQTITKHGDVGSDVRSQYIPEPGYVFIQADSAQAEARVVFLLADDEQALKDIDEHDYHALTASWFFGGSESDYSKRALGYESPIRFAGKTLRHAGHLGASARRAKIELNTQARKYKIDITITERKAEDALKIFHKKQPNIKGVFQNGIIECLSKDKRILTSSVPYGIDSAIGGKRQFFERWGDELFRQAFSYIPQRSVSDNTKACALRLKEIIPDLRIIMEAHDALLFMVREVDVDDFVPIIRTEMERPISFIACSLSRRDLVIPCDIEIGYNYMDLKKFKKKEITI